MFITLLAISIANIKYLFVFKKKKKIALLKK